MEITIIGFLIYTAIWFLITVSLSIRHLQMKAKLRAFNEFLEKNYGKEKITLSEKEKEVLREVGVLID